MDHPPVVDNFFSFEELFETGDIFLLQKLAEKGLLQLSIMEIREAAGRRVLKQLSGGQLSSPDPIHEGITLLKLLKLPVPKDDPEATAAVQKGLIILLNHFAALSGEESPEEGKLALMAADAKKLSKLFHLSKFTERAAKKLAREQYRAGHQRTAIKLVLTFSLLPPKEEA